MEMIQVRRSREERGVPECLPKGRTKEEEEEEEDGREGLEGLDEGFGLE